LAKDRFPTVVAPRYLGAPGRVPDADRVVVDVADTILDIPVKVQLSIGDVLTGDAVPSCPSHTLVIVLVRRA
jgi:Ca-activated chloride channel homolog